MKSLQPLLLAATATRSAGDDFEVPHVLINTDAERGLISTVALKVINNFTKKGIDIAVAKAARDFERKQLGNSIGLYNLDNNFNLLPVAFTQTDNPYLLFLHGTASSTSGSFVEIKDTQLWEHICNNYGSNILAFQHKSLTKSPLQNARNLVEKLPANVTLHLITHSRGGLIGDILCRFCNTDKTKRGFNADELLSLKNEKRDSDIQYIQEINKLLSNKNIRIEKYLRVACPASGTILASKRMDTYFNVIANLTGLFTGVAGNPVFTAFKNLIAAAINTKDDTKVLPALRL